MCMSILAILWSQEMVNPHVNSWSYFWNITAISVEKIKLAPAMFHTSSLTMGTAVSKLFPAGGEERGIWGGSCRAWGSYWILHRGRVREQKQELGGLSGKRKGLDHRCRFLFWKFCTRSRRRLDSTWKGTMKQRLFYDIADLIMYVD